MASYSPSIHLGVADTALDSASSPSCLRVRIKSSKTDPFSKGCFVHIGRGTYPLCALQALLSYLTIRGDGPGHFFLLQDGRPLSRSLLTAWMRRILMSAGVPGNFSSHSFRIGAATVAARNGIPDHQIQALGRWSSSAYLSYIRTPAWVLFETNSIFLLNLHVHMKLENKKILGKNWLYLRPYLKLSLFSMFLKLAGYIY